MDQPAPAHETAADTGAKGDEHVVVASPPGAEFALGPGGGGRVVHDGHVKARSAGEFGTQRVLDEIWKIGGVVDDP